VRSKAEHKIWICSGFGEAGQNLRAVRERGLCSVLLSFFEGLTFRMAHLRTRGEIMAGTKRRKDELGPDSAGQSGDIQQMPNAAEADSESVEELVEEGNAVEADAVEGVEDASDPDVSEVTTREVPEDDVPSEYQKDEDVA
jgi:hypothetical protein